jgi:hypothetical protein
MEPQRCADGTCHGNKSSRMLFRPPRGKEICCVRSVIATVPAAPADEVSTTTWREWQGCALGAAEPVIRVFSPGQLPSNMPGTCTAECAATWTCRASPANMGWACLRGCFACCGFPRIAVPRAAIASSHSGFTVVLFLRSKPWNRGRSPIPSCTSAVFPSEI